MSSAKGTHVQDVSVLERRLRPIYDWLDLSNYKKAIQECEKVLKKSPHLGRVKALKALALLRLGREAECLNILEGLKKETITDDAFLQAISLCYRELNQHDKVCTLYEIAVKADTLNEELHTHLFMSYVRVANFQKQQRSAMALFKLMPKNPYYCWAVMSVILQATRGAGQSDPTQKKILLWLAERMLDKIIQENKLEAEPEVQLYIMILNEQERYDKILEVLEGPMGQSLIWGDSVQNKLPYLLKLKRWALVNTECKKILADSVNRWDIWLNYLQSVFELQAQSGLAQEEKVNAENCLDDFNCDYSIDDTPEKAHEFLCKMIENGAQDGGYLRGPFLARFELAKRMADAKQVADLLGDVSELFIEYFRKFGHKPCCVSDLKPYLTLLNDKKRLELARRVANEVNIQGNVFESETEMQRHIGALQLSRLCGCHGGDMQRKDALDLVANLQLFYTHGHDKFGQNLLVTDQGPADAYILLAAHILYDLYVRHEGHGPSDLLAAVALLQNALKNSPSNFHVKLLLLRIYHILGLSREAHALYQSLDVKHLQLDSLCYIHGYHLANCCYYTVANQLLDTTVKFFAINYRDSADSLTFSYKFGSFAKLAELMDFRERMRNSFHYATSAIDRIYTGLVLATTGCDQTIIDFSDLVDQNAIWPNIRDNSDLSVYVSYDPKSIELPLEKWAENLEIFRKDLHVYKVRAELLKCLQLSLKVGKSAKKEDRVVELKSLQELIENVEELHRNSLTLSENQNGQVSESLSLVLPSKLDSYRNTDFCALLLSAVKIVASINTSKSMPEHVESLKQRLIGLNGTISGISVNNCTETRMQVEQLSNYLEIISFLTLVCTIFSNLVKSANDQGTTKKSKKHQQQQQNSLNNSETLQSGREMVQSLVSSVKESMKIVDLCLANTLSDLEERGKSGDGDEALEVTLGTLSLCDDAPQRREILANLFASKRGALQEARAVLKTKLKLLSTVS